MGEPSSMTGGTTMGEITQADREAAAKCAVLVEMRDMIRAGRADHHAEPWKAHRLTERAAIVAWLRQPRNGMGYVGRVLADKIEAGEHLSIESCPRCGHDTDSKVHQWCKQKEPNE